MQYHAKQVGEYADALKSTKKDSIYDKARESGNTDQIVSDVKSFVNQYNNMLDDLEESGTRSDQLVLTQLNGMFRSSERDLALTGVTRNADGRLVVDEKKLEAADVDTLEKYGAETDFPRRRRLRQELLRLRRRKTLRRRRAAFTARSIGQISTAAAAAEIREVILTTGDSGLQVHNVRYHTGSRIADAFDGNGYQNESYQLDTAERRL